MTQRSPAQVQPPAEAGLDPAQGASPDVRVPLAGGWTAWPWIWLRGAGFPADLVLRLATEGAATAAAAAGQVAREQDAARAAALAACEGALVDARGADSARLSRMVKRLRGGAAELAVDGLPDPLATALAALSKAGATLAAKRAELEGLLESEGTGARAALQEIVRDQRVREAMIWQNRRFVRGSADAFLRRPARDSDAKMREYERVLATYVQRYAVRNETIGFFGPVGWAGWAETSGLRDDPDLHRLATRTVYFEHWAIDALARRLAGDPAVRAHLAPRRMPSVRLDGDRLHYGVDGAAELPAPFARVLALCDGEARPAAIAERVAGCAEADLPDQASVLDVLDELAGKGLITWTLELHTGDPHPERALRRLLEGLPERTAAPGLAALDRLEAKREGVARAAGDPDALDRAIGELEASFTELTEIGPTRREGRSYAGRGLLFEDCRRGGAVQLGSDLRRDLARPLELLLRAARWYTYEIGRRYRRLFGEAYDELRTRTGLSHIPMPLYRRHIDPSFPSSQYETAPTVLEVVGLLHARWRDVLDLPDLVGVRRIERSTTVLDGRAREAFAAPHAGWPGARYHSPDVLLAAADPAAISAGDYLWVLGEMHVGVNTLLTHVAVQQHAAPDDLVRARELDRPDPAITPVESGENASRADNVPVARHDLHVETGPTRSFRPRAQVLAIADLLVTEAEGRLIVATVDGRHRFDILHFFEQDLTFAAHGGFSLLERAPHAPRVTIDRLVVARERWSFRTEALGFARAAASVDRFIGAQLWREDNRLPRFLFAKVSSEPKPLFIDLSSASYVEILAKCARASESVELSEMLPGLDELWLADASGRRYTSEFRIAALDPEAWRPE